MIGAPKADFAQVVVPKLPEDELVAAEECAHDPATAQKESTGVRGARPKRGGTRRRHYRWADLLRRVFEVDVLVCDLCGGRRKVMTFLTEPRIVRGILEHLGLPTELPYR
jgi:hypothetical protein